MIFVSDVLAALPPEIAGLVFGWSLGLVALVMAHEPPADVVRRQWIPDPPAPSAAVDGSIESMNWLTVRCAILREPGQSPLMTEIAAAQLANSIQIALIMAQLADRPDVTDALLEAKQRAIVG